MVSPAEGGGQGAKGFNDLIPKVPPDNSAAGGKYLHRLPRRWSSGPSRQPPFMETTEARSRKDETGTAGQLRWRIEPWDTPINIQPWACFGEKHEQLSVLETESLPELHSGHSDDLRDTDLALPLEP